MRVWYLCMIVIKLNIAYSRMVMSDDDDSKMMNKEREERRREATTPAPAPATLTNSLPSRSSWAQWSPPLPPPPTHHTPHPTPHSSSILLPLFSLSLIFLYIDIVNSLYNPHAYYYLCSTLHKYSPASPSFQFYFRN